MDEELEGTLNEGDSSLPEAADTDDQLSDTTAEQSINNDSAQEPDERLDKHPRFQELIQQTNTYKSQVEQYREQMAALEAEAERARRYSPFLDKLEQEGLNDAPAIDAKLTQEAEQSHRETRIAFYKRQVDTGEMDIEFAQTKLEAEFLKRDLDIQREVGERQKNEFQQATDTARAQQYQLYVDTELKRLQEAFPLADPDDIRDLHYAGKGDLETIAARLHAKQQKFHDDAIAKYNAEQAKVRATPVPEGRGGAAPPRPTFPDPAKDPVAFQRWIDDEGRKTDIALGR